MKIGIIGGGAIGLLFASYLSETNKVTIYTRSEEQASTINREGLIFEKDGLIRKLPVFSVTFPDASVHENDLLIVAVKQYHIQEIITEIQHNDCKLLFLQNGMGHLQYMDSLEKNHGIYLGVVEHGALKTSQNKVIHTGNGLTKISPYTPLLKPLQFKQNDKLFPISWEENYLEMLTNKLIVNCMINPLTAVLGITNGTLVKNPNYYTLLEKYFNEIADALKVDNKIETFEQVKAICKKTAENRSSMLRDVEEGRKTEIDSILGYVIKVAQEQQMNTPIAESLYLMVKGKEYNGREN